MTPMTEWQGNITILDVSRVVFLKASLGAHGFLLKALPVGAAAVGPRMVTADTLP